MQAATIVHVFADEYDINTSQLTASGKGEFEPKASNETEEGKATNDRMEWIISQRDSDMERAIRKVLK
jgi:chemotaxis protein MotB